MNLNTDTPSSNIACKGYGTHTALPKDTLPKCKKGSQTFEISCKEVKREKHQGQLSNIIYLNCGTIIYIELSISKKFPSYYVLITTPKGYISTFQLLLELTYLQMRIYLTEEWKKFPHIFLIPNMDWNPSFPHFTEDRYAKYHEWL